MDLIFQIPMQYCSLECQTLLPPPVTSSTGWCFHFGFISLFFWSYFSILLQQHIGHLPTWGVHLSVSYLFAFMYCSWGSQGKNTVVVCHSILQYSSLKSKEFLTRALTCMNLEDIMLSEMSQTQKDKCYVIPLL